MKIVYLFATLVLAMGCAKIEYVENLAGSEGNQLQARPALLAGEDIPYIDSAVNAFMAANEVPGISLAITRKGKLIYRKSYGVADRTTQTPMTDSTRSRVSSISKGITAIAILKLREDSLLDFDDRIFGAGGILDSDFGTQPYGPYIADLTIGHCLQHHLGGWGNASNDPTMAQQSLNANQLISWILDNRPLDTVPGTEYNYSNVGYMILGRVIEKLTGLTYEAYVQQQILEPIGVTGMEIGGNTLAERKPNEARYHGVGSENPYAYNFERRDANGGWLATSEDLVRLLVHVDGFSTVPDLLQPQSITDLYSPLFAHTGYGCGFYLSTNSKFHSGSFPGSRSYWRTTAAGTTGAVLANTSAAGLGDLLIDVMNAPVTWPTEDLFE